MTSSEEGTLVNTDKKSVESDDIEQYILEENDIVLQERAILQEERISMISEMVLWLMLVS